MFKKKFKYEYEPLDKLDIMIYEAVMKHELHEDFDEIDIPQNEEIKYSFRHKIRMNRLFRDEIGSTRLPFPEADNFYERIRSKIVVKLKVKKLLDRDKNTEGKNK